MKIKNYCLKMRSSYIATKNIDLAKIKFPVTASCRDPNNASQTVRVKMMCEHKNSF